MLLVVPIPFVSSVPGLITIYASLRKTIWTVPKPIVVIASSTITICSSFALLAEGISTQGIGSLARTALARAAFLIRTSIFRSRARPILRCRGVRLTLPFALPLSTNNQQTSH
jgi:hypothetical protein